MKKILFVAASLVSIAVSTSACADAGFDLAKKKDCLYCHAVKKDSFGPAFAKIAAKYRDDASAKETLVATVLKGSAATGGYHWGNKKMPKMGARPVVSQGEATELVEWILSK